MAGAEHVAGSLHQLGEQAGGGDQVEAARQGRGNTAHGPADEGRQIRRTDRSPLRPFGEGVEHAGHVDPAMRGEGGVAGHALASRSACQGFGVQIHQVDLPVGFHERRQVEVIGIARTQDAESRA